MEAVCAVDKLDAKVPVHTCACVVCYTHMWVVIYMAFLLGVSVIMSQNFNWVYCTSCYVSVIVWSTWYEAVSGVLNAAKLTIMVGQNTSYVSILMC